MNKTNLDYQALANHVKQLGLALGFQQVGITDIDLSAYEPRFKTWLAHQFHGEMDYLEAHGEKRTRPDLLIPGTLRVICVRLDYLPPSADCFQTLNNSRLGYVSRYALGKDYHKLIRKRLTTLARQLSEKIGPFGYRAFTDSAPVLEKPLAEKAGLGWIGKHTNLINRQAGSWFFLGEIYTDLPLPLDTSDASHCGSCQACITVCPTAAIIAPYQLDARRCISYLTIELKGSIPVPLRPLLGNRIYGCDDCQLVCPWNKFAKFTNETAFHPRHQLDTSTLIDLFNWDEATFLKRTEGSAIRRIGHERWLRNIAVALGNADYDETLIQALKNKLEHPSHLVREHVQWALANQDQKYRT